MILLILCILISAIIVGLIWINDDKANAFFVGILLVFILLIIFGCSKAETVHTSDKMVELYYSIVTDVKLLDDSECRCARIEELGEKIGKYNTTMSSKYRASRSFLLKGFISYPDNIPPSLNLEDLIE